MKSIQEESYKSNHLTLCKKAPWAIGYTASKRPVARTSTEGLVFQKAVRIELQSIISKDILIKVQLPKQDQHFGTTWNYFASNFRGGRDHAYGR